MPPALSRSRFQALAVAAVLLVPAPLRAGSPQPDPDPQDLKRLSIEELMQIDVMLPSREAEPVLGAAAAIHVVTAEDIRRSGVTTIADAVALADSVHVARFNNGTWAVSVRGFNATASNKLLVMVDGRTEYSPLFSGVFWNMLDYVLEDVERIEVIRGPGATLWGANAVNGIINIVTRHSRDTQGTYVGLGSGNEDPVLVDARYGGEAGGAAYRVYGKYAHRGSQTFGAEGSSGDARRRGQMGFRLDRGAAERGAWVVAGNVLQSRDELPDRPAGEFVHAALSGGWSRTYAAGSRVELRSYYRREHREVPLQLTHSIDTIDIEAQHSFAPIDRHRLIWGSGYRLNADRTTGGTIRFEPTARRYSLFHAFVQDDITLRPGRLYVTPGVKLERNGFSGAEWQPSVRVRLLLPGQTVWGAVSRAVRRPTRLDVDVRSFTSEGLLAAIGGGDAYRAESLVASELGYRVQPSRVVALDAAVFTHRYDDLRSQELPPGGPPIIVGNTLNAASHGLELAVTLQPVPAWRTQASYRYLNLSFERDPDSRDIGGGASEANDPRHLFSLRTAIDLPRQVEVDAHIRGVGRLERPPVPAYAELNARIGWRPTSRLELSLVGQDLLHGRHPEFGAPQPRRVEFQRSVRALVAIRH